MKLDPIFSSIGSRAAAIAAAHRRDVNAQEIAVTIACAHASRPLDLERLLAADDGNFTHDVFGICRHYDVVTGGMRDCFSPRFTKR